MMRNILYPLILFLIMGCLNDGTKQVVVKKEILNTEEMKLRGKVGFMEPDSSFLKMVHEEIVTNEDEKKYISDISMLKSIKLIYCDSMNIHFRDAIEGKRIELKLSLEIFDMKKHKIQYKVNSEGGYQDCELIDGKRPWGGIYGHPETEIKKLEVRVNGKNINLQDHLQDVYDFRMCDQYYTYFNPNPSLKYDIDNEVFYLYIRGGNAADSYFGKIVFDDNQYITRYLVPYIKLSKTGSFGTDFKGF